MKKVLSLILSMVMLVSMSVTAFAADTQASNHGATGQSTVIATADSQFTVIIPETIYIDESYYFTASYMNIQEQEEVYVRFTNLSENDTLTVTNESGISTEIKIMGLADAFDKCASFRNGELTSSIYFYADFVDGNAPAGEYTGIAEFVIYCGVAE